RPVNFLNESRLWHGSQVAAQLDGHDHRRRRCAHRTNCSSKGEPCSQIVQATTRQRPPEAGGFSSRCRALRSPSHPSTRRGRCLPPSDRANLYGPYYAHHWAVFADGVQDGYPFIFQGRDNGVMYWGQFGKVKVSGGGFDGASATGNTKVLAAGRVQVDFWDPEAGYYLNGTYYGGKNLLAIGVAGQGQGSHNGAASVDLLPERQS